MKKMLMLGAALSLVSGLALAGTVSGTPSSTGATLGPDTVTQIRAESGGPGGDWKRGKHHGKHHDRSAERGPRHGFGPPSRGAHIILERNGNRIDVKCAAGDSTEQCVAAVKDLMDHVAAKMGRGSRPDAPAPDGGPAPQQ